ncbi:hypothetical protein HDU85_003767 [Gaertneriomyces sp. JEL0708]|nr:hypothetical protein HDU85_003767 [Gaertneriomyces sp. JEL0708]
MPSVPSLLTVALLATGVAADMRVASLAKRGFRDDQIRKDASLANGRKGQFAAGGLARRQNVATFPYQVPSNFGYKALKNQEKNNNDNFLRSNIDNEANQRNTNNELAKDMTPCRQDGLGQSPLMQLQPGQNFEIPLQFNNPHDGECEVNIWANMNQTVPDVAPIARFACGGGFAQNRPNVTLPADFPVDVCAPGKGCLMQLYWHTVEPRTYAVCTNVEITPGAAAPKKLFTRQTTSVKFNPARCFADSFDTAHIDSTHSGYRGQQPEAVGAQLAARIEMQSFTGNGGLLKDAEPRNVIQTRNNLRKQVENAVKRAEKAATKLNKAAQAQLDATCGSRGCAGAYQGDEFAVVLNPTAKRQFTNTYVTNVDYTAIRDSFLPKFQAAGLAPQGVATKDSCLTTPEVFGMKKNSLKKPENAAALAPNLAKALGATAQKFLARRAAGELIEDDEEYNDSNPDDAQGPADDLDADFE